MQTQHLSTVETLFSMNGRIKRSTFWLWSLPIGAINGIVGLIDKTSHSINGLFLFFIVAVFLLWPAIALGVKRCHDRNRSGLFVLLGFIPFINFWYLVDIGFLRGTSGENRYGPDPISAPAQELAGGSGTSPLNLKAFLFGTLKFLSALAIVAALSWAFWIYRQDVETKKWMKQAELQNQKREALAVPKEWPVLADKSGMSFTLKTKWQDSLRYQFTVTNPSPDIYQAVLSERVRWELSKPAISWPSRDAINARPRFEVVFLGSDGFTLLTIPIPFAFMTGIGDFSTNSYVLQAESSDDCDDDDYTKLASWTVKWYLPAHDSGE